MGSYLVPPKLILITIFRPVCCFNVMMSSTAAMAWPNVPDPVLSKTLKLYKLAPFATPYVVPAAVPAVISFKNITEHKEN